MSELRQRIAKAMCCGSECILGHENGRLCGAGTLRGDEKRLNALMAIVADCEGGAAMAAEQHGRQAERAAARPDRDGWQPIETAPKDGSSILIWVPGEFPKEPERKGYIDVGQWAKRQYLSGGEYWAFNDTLFGKPTKWMCQPDPPATVE